MRKRLTAAFLCLCLLFTLLPATAFAEGETGSGAPQAGSALCEHHQQHDESCGYTEGTEEIPCTHEHDEDCYKHVTECVHEHTAECYPEESVSENTATPSEPEEAEPTACTHECSEESGCITKTLDCKHEHDEACGYVPATGGTPCTFVCEVCNAQDSGDTATPSDAQPEECTCETLCTEEEVNGDCPVCSAEGAELDKVCIGAAPMLPVTALAAGNDSPHSLYVGNTNFASTIYPDNAAYWTSSDGGTNWTSQLEKPTGDSYIHYNGQDTLTLHNANIQGQYDSSNIYSGYGIYAVGATGSAISLTIQLEGTNTVSGWSGIFVHAVDGAASLSISGTGSLATEGTGGISFSGIVVQGNGGKAELTINNVDVTATNTSDYAQGILLQSADSSPATLTVNGGELTASGQRAGIKYVFGSSGTGGGTPTVTVSNNAIVRANGGISDDSSTDIQIGADSNESNGGIVWNGKDGTVYGDVTLQEDLEIGEGESLTLDDGASLNAGNHNVIVDGGTLDENLANSLGNSVKYAPTITNHPKNVEVKENETATFNVKVTGTELSYQWQQNMNGSGWRDITGETNATYTTGKTTMDMNGTQYRCVVKNSIKEVTSNTATLTVQKSMTPIEPEFVRYIVEHYKQNADGSYTLADTEQPVDEIGKTVTATPKTYEGYTYNPNAAGTVVSGTLKAISSPDDIVTLKLYYDITLYTVTVNGSYAQTTGAGSYAKGATVAIDAGTRSGYTFDGWTSSDGVTFANAGSTQTTFTMPDKAVTVTANWTKKSGGGGGSSNSSGGGSYTGPVGVYYADGGNDSITSDATQGNWEQETAADGSISWRFKLTDGSYAADRWIKALWNDQYLWYHTDAGGYLQGGWFTDTDGNIYYLHPFHDGNFGYMYTGDYVIDGVAYSFSRGREQDGLPEGAMKR